ncbi:helix-turn-helix transcriptional regulator [Clostridium boliviensis]|uniref:Helix-turn-helix transcriptional regulator n=1 Tax=Clostridium boliviensis TaxID=318465 RepID=A0ABU4GHL6_9CLOT|nr:helix-turn-helix transcriptional regulator [Clostridium boliviensis]MDW2797110.1 helix-turn-helix transcriptional regulator [Clostridium boliviensis]
MNAMEARKSRFFKNMFLSYCLFIILSFLVYSATVIYEAVKVKENQAVTYYETKAQAFANGMDQQIYNAQNIISNLNNSSLINKLYMTVQMNSPVDSYLLYQILNDIRYQKTAGDDFNISDVVLMLNDYNKIYTSDEVIHLSDRIDLSGWNTDCLAVTDLNTCLNMNNSKLTFFKQYLIYSGAYQYGSGSQRGIICVLFENQKIQEMLKSASGEACGYAVYYNGKPVIKEGIEDGRFFKQNSRVSNLISYEIIAKKDKFGFELSDLGSIAMLFGFFICMGYLIIAYFFANRYSSPFEKIRNLVGKEKIVSGVMDLLGERNGYMQQVHNMSPYASQGILHSLIMGNDEESGNKEFIKEFIQLKRVFFMTAMVDLYFGEKWAKEESKKALKAISDLAEKESDAEFKILCYEKDALHVYLIFNSNNGEHLEDRLYEFFEKMKKTLGAKCVVTVGADDVKEELEELSVSCDNVMLALEKILWEGRGIIYFHDIQSDCSMNYYFPKDGIRQLTKGIRDQDRESISHFFEEIEKRNQMDFDNSVYAGKLLLSELYVTVVKAMQAVWDQCGIPLRRVDKCPPYRTMEEVIGYYSSLVTDLFFEMYQAEEIRDNNNQSDLELIEYINQNDKDPNLSLTQIAEHFSVSSKYVTALVKKQFGMTYLKYVQERRISHAIDLLKNSSLSLEKIAEECGYTNMLTFRRNFKAIMACNPSDFRGDKTAEDESL